MNKDTEMPTAGQVVEWHRLVIALLGCGAVIAAAVIYNAYG
jgi:hypothetical protein